MKTRIKKIFIIILCVYLYLVIGYNYAKERREVWNACVQYVGVEKKFIVLKDVKGKLPTIGEWNRNEFRIFFPLTMSLIIDKGMADIDLPINNFKKENYLLITSLIWPITFIVNIFAGLIFG
jgi:hypothetical protein